MLRCVGKGPGGFGGILLEFEASRMILNNNSFHGQQVCTKSDKAQHHSNQVSLHEN
jgi:hypothetical protein